MLHCIDITSEGRGGSANTGSEREVACSGRESKDPTVTEGLEGAGKCGVSTRARREMMTLEGRQGCTVLRCASTEVLACEKKVRHAST